MTRLTVTSVATSPDGKLFTHRLACLPGDGVSLAASCTSSQVPVKSFGGIEFAVLVRPSPDAVTEPAANFAIDVRIAATFIDARHAGKVFLVTGALSFKRTGVTAGTKAQQSHPFSLTIAVPTLTSPTTPVCVSMPIILPFNTGTSINVVDLAVTATWRQLATLSLAKHIRQVPEQLGFLRFLHDERVSDCAFLVKGADTPIYASRVMLVRSSSFFMRMFLGVWRESSTTDPISFDSWHVAAVALVLIHIYSGWVPGEPLPNQTPEQLRADTLAMTVIQQLKALLDEQLRDLSLTADLDPESDGDDDAVANFKKRRVGRKSLDSAPMFTPGTTSTSGSCVNGPALVGTWDAAPPGPASVAQVPMAFGFLTPSPASGFWFGAASPLTWPSIQFDTPPPQASSSSAPSTGGSFSFASTAGASSPASTAATTPSSSFAFSTPGSLFSSPTTAGGSTAASASTGTAAPAFSFGAAAPLLTTATAPASSTGTFLFGAARPAAESSTPAPKTPTPASSSTGTSLVGATQPATASPGFAPAASTPATAASSSTSTFSIDTASLVATSSAPAPASSAPATTTPPSALTGRRKLRVLPRQAAAGPKPETTITACPSASAFTFAATSPVSASSTTPTASAPSTPTPSSGAARPAAASSSPAPASTTSSPTPASAASASTSGTFVFGAPPAAGTGSAAAPATTGATITTAARAAAATTTTSASSIGAENSALGSFAITALQDSISAGGRFMDALAAASSSGSAASSAESVETQAAASPTASPASQAAPNPGTASGSPTHETDESSLSDWTSAAASSSSSSMPLIDLANESDSEADEPSMSPTPEPETLYASGMTFTRPHVTPSSPAWPFAPQSPSAITTTDLPSIFPPAAGWSTFASVAAEGSATRGDAGSSSGTGSASGAGAARGRSAWHGAGSQSGRQLW
ncbi:hypothetical protein GGF32_004020 [Allomyces javanicus]|nr:hypothetical protein GGF32_004020 [Allomyces javanicus]